MAKSVEKLLQDGKLLPLSDVIDQLYAVEMDYAAWPLGVIEEAAHGSYQTNFEPLLHASRLLLAGGNEVPDLNINSVLQNHQHIVQAHQNHLTDAVSAIDHFFEHNPKTVLFTSPFNTYKRAGHYVIGASVTPARPPYTTHETITVQTVKGPVVPHPRAQLWLNAKHLAPELKVTLGVE